MLSLVAYVIAIALTPQEQEELCLTISDLSVATIEAREAGVPLEKVLQYFRSLDDGSKTAEIFVEMARKGVLKTYSEPPIGIDKMSDHDRQQLINRFTAECILEFEQSETPFE